MDILMLAVEMIGTVAFAVSGSLTATKKNMDLFGVCILGITTAVGGGIVRDMILGRLPPATFSDPKYFLVSLVTAIIVFIPIVRRVLYKSPRVFEVTLLISDSLGLGVFTVYGVKVAVGEGFSDNPFLVIFVAVLTGVGGGVLRDIFAGDRPYIFVKHIYACAAIAGAGITLLLCGFISVEYSMLIGMTVIFVLRICAAIFRWSLPRAKFIEYDKEN